VLSGLSSIKAETPSYSAVIHPPAQTRRIHKTGKRPIFRCDCSFPGLPSLRDLLKICLEDPLPSSRGFQMNVETDDLRHDRLYDDCQADARSAVIVDGEQELVPVGHPAGVMFEAMNKARIQRPCAFIFINPSWAIEGFGDRYSTPRLPRAQLELAPAIL